MLLTSITSGQLISRWGRYKAFPIAGTAVMTLGLFPLSRMNEQTSVLLESLSMLVLGLGLGLVMQVLERVSQPHWLICLAFTVRDSTQTPHCGKIICQLVSQEVVQVETCRPAQVGPAQVNAGQVGPGQISLKKGSAG